jgi:hypothetical protein
MLLQHVQEHCFLSFVFKAGWININVLLPLNDTLIYYALLLHECTDCCCKQLSTARRPERASFSADIKEAYEQVREPTPGEH